MSAVVISVIKAAGPERGKRSEYLAADSNNCIIASKSRSAAAPRTPGRRDCVRHAEASFCPSLAIALSHIAQSNSSARADLFRATARAFLSSS